MKGFDQDPDGGDVMLHALGRRRHYRVTCDLEARYSFPDGGPEGRARLANIGLGGARIDLDREVTPPAEIHVKVDLSPLEEEGGTRRSAGELELDLQARVVWTVSDRECGPYPTGVQFQGLSDEVRRLLYDLIGSLMR